MALVQLVVLLITFSCSFTAGLQSELAAPRGVEHEKVMTASSRECPKLAAASRADA